MRRVFLRRDSSAIEMEHVYNEEAVSSDEEPECRSCRLRRMGACRVVEDNRKTVYTMCRRQEEWLQKYGLAERKPKTLGAREKLCAYWREAKRKFDVAFPEGAEIPQNKLPPKKRV